MPCAIYAIIHRDTKRHYVGSAASLKVRWVRHRNSLIAGSHYNHKLQRSWSKHGESAFDVVVVQRVDLAEDLIFWEQFWIDKLEPYYNVCPVAGSMLGFKHSDEAKDRIAADALKRWSDPSRREALINCRRAWTLGPEGRAKIAATHAKRYSFTSPLGDVVHVLNLKAFCVERGLSYSGMRNLTKRIVAQCRGWRLST